MRHSIWRTFARGGSALGLATGLERGLGFLASMLAARFGGPQVFGAYSVAVATAGTVATYTGLGIGATANRFSGQYPRESRGYRGLLGALLWVSLGSALLAALVLLIGASPLARLLLRKENLASLLRLAAVSAGAMILLDCCRGFLVGQQRFQAVLVLSGVLGLGLLVVLPSAARISPGAMVAGQAGVALLAVLVLGSLARRLDLTPLPANQVAGTAGPGLRPVLVFGLVQFSGVVGISIASWWLASLVVRNDASMVQMGLYAVANQLRGLASIAPGLFVQVGYPLLAEESAHEYGGPDRVIVINTFVVTVLALTVAGLAIAALPWLLLYTYGRVYMTGELACGLALATAITHMGVAPAYNRLSILDLRSIAMINGVWALLLILLGGWLVPKMGASGATGAFLLAHTASLILVLIALRRVSRIPQGLLKLSFLAIGGAWTLAGLAFLRALASSNELALTGAILAAVLFLLLALGYLGLSAGWLPRKLGWKSLGRRARALLSGELRET